MAIIGLFAVHTCRSVGVGITVQPLALFGFMDKVHSQWQCLPFNIVYKAKALTVKIYMHTCYKISLVIT